jgi:hypothetical protein
MSLEQLLEVRPGALPDCQNADILHALLDVSLLPPLSSSHDRPIAMLSLCRRIRSAQLLNGDPHPRGSLNADIWSLAASLPLPNRLIAELPNRHI